MSKYRLSGFSGRYLKDWNPNQELHLNALGVLHKLFHTNEAHKRYLKSLKENDNDGRELIELQEVLQEKKRAITDDLASIDGALEYINMAIIRLLEHQAFTRGYDGGVEDSKPIRRKKGGATA